MMGKAWGNVYRSTTVCIDNYDKGILSGRLFNPYLDTGQTFDSLTQFLFRMEQTLDRMNFPQATTAPRSFADAPKEAVSLAEADHQTGKAATFVVKVLFRQNASWQGSVLWQEGGKEESFRSVLELIFLMDSALNTAEEKAG